MNELTFNLNLKVKTPLYEQIYQYIKTDIQTGKLRAGERIPSTRALAKHLEVSRNTIELAYEQLLSEGYIEAEPYKGYYVAEIEELYQLKHDQLRPAEEKKEKKNYLYDLTPNGIDLNSFPYNTWRKLSKEILQDGSIQLFRSGDPQGEYSFRCAICNYIHQARGVNCTPEQIIVGAGNDYLLMLLSMIIGNSFTVAFENPTYKQAYRMTEELGYQTITVPMDKYGMNVEELKKTTADIAYVTPSHQYPTGIVMPVRRRSELLKWANEKEERYVIEDDYDSEFRYKGKPIPALQGFDSGNKVIYLGTFSKSIAPAIRLSYLILPEPLLERYKKKTGFVSSTVSRLDQMIVQKFLEEGYFERHLNKVRALYRTRHDVFIEALKPLHDICDISGENAGVHFLLTFKNGMNEEVLIEKAEDRGIKVYGMSEFTIDRQKTEKATILLGYANLSEEQLKKVAELLVKCWK